MSELKETLEERKERAIIVGVDLGTMDDFAESMEELEALAEACNMEVVCVVLSCPDMWEKSNKLLDSALGNYRMIKVLESDNILDFNDNPPTKTIAHAKNDVYLPLLKDEYNKVKYEIIYYCNKK